MNGYFAKMIVIFVIAAVGAGIHLGSAWPVKLKAEPDAPPTRTLVIPGSADAAPPTLEQEATTDTAEVDVDEAAIDGTADSSDDSGQRTDTTSQTITLDSLEIDLATARVLHENQMATFVDARLTEQFEAGHIADAMNISPSMLEENASLFVLDVIDPELPIVIYCGGGDCDDSHRVAELLQDLRGFEQTHVFVDGFPAWEQAGLPTSSGPDPWAE